MTFIEKIFITGEIPAKHQPIIWHTLIDGHERKNLAYMEGKKKAIITKGGKI